MSTQACHFLNGDKRQWERDRITMNNISYDDLGESSGEKAKGIKNTTRSDTEDKYSSDEDKLSEAGDAGVSDKFHASYQVILFYTQCKFNVTMKASGNKVAYPGRRGGHVSRIRYCV